MRIAAALAFVLAVPCLGCSLAIPSSYVSSDEVTLPQAMKDLACGLRTFQNESSKIGLRTGSVLDQAEVTLNLKASATGTSTLVVDAKPVVPQFSSLGINYSDKTEIVGERGNQVKITLKNIYTAGLNDPGKAIVKKQGPPLDLGPSMLYPVQNPCEQQIYSQEDLSRATKINVPVRR
jgi:hypothetical protein